VILKIRQEQVALLDGEMRERFIERTLAGLPAVFPDDPRVRDERAMRALIEDGIARAAGFRITGAREVSLFVFLLHEYGPDFEEQEGRGWMGRILWDRGLGEGEKMDLIYTRLELASSRGGRPE